MAGDGKTDNDLTAKAGGADIGRRGFLGMASVAGLASAAALASPAEAAQGRRAATPAAGRGPLGQITTPTSAIVETRAGKVRGYLADGVYTYKGIHYGATTAGAARFAPPQPVKPWAGVKNTMVFGAICPQNDYARDADASPSFLRQNQFEFASEDCLVLNVWTPGVNDGRRRPVMVWFHGGAFLNGSANRPSTWGENLARRGDVVVVTVHHRLNVFGYLDLSGFGDQYRDSANAGALDMVAALQWVRDNIANFGGDNGNVTIFGQSGGGAKVAALMVMPSAKGLFHRACVQSSSSQISSAAGSERLAAKFLQALDIDKGSLSKLNQLPMETLLKTGVQVAAAPLNPGDDWRPKVDGRVVLQQPFEPGAPALSADIPVLIGGTRHEFAPDPMAGPIPEDQLMNQLTRRFGAKAAELHSFFTRTYPGISTNEILALVNVQPYRANHMANAAKRAALGKKNTWYYVFAWKTANLDGLPLAYHSAEVPFVFHNVAECAPFTGGGPDAYALAAQVSDTWLAFARNGNPNHDGLPRWDAYDPARANAMVFDDRTQVVNDPWKSEREALLAAAGGMIAKPNAEELGRR